MKLVNFLPAGLLFLVTLTAANAQEKASFGIKGGLNYSTVTQGKFEEGPDARTSFHIGVVGEVPIVPNIFSIQPEVLYSQQGFESNVTLLGNTYTTTHKIDYLNIPVLAKLYLVKGLSLEAGPQFGFKLNESHDSDNSSIETNEVNKFDTALALGATFNLSGGIFIFGRYTYSLNEVVKDTDAKNKVLQAGIGFKF